MERGPLKDPFFDGGQAVIEGVMMRGKRHYAVAVRLPNTKEIIVDRGELKAAIYVNPIWKLPVLRGLALLGEQLHLGMKSLIWSANMNAGGNDVVIGKKEITGSVAFAAVFGLALFLGLPLLLAGLAVHRSGSFLFVVVEGVIRVALVLGYLSAIALLPDVRRVFQYHGAEHKTINAFEAGWPLDVASVRRASLLHPRCGTEFLVVVIALSIIAFGLIGHQSIAISVTSRIVLIPVIAAVGYELLRWGARHRSNPIVKTIMWPGILVQMITTKQPSDDQIEVAIVSMEQALAADGEAVPEGSERPARERLDPEPTAVAAA